MKILYIITKSEMGGAQTQVWQLAKNFSAAGHEVFVTSSVGGWLSEKARELGVKYFENKFFKNSYSPLNALRAIKEVRRTIKKIKPDIVHCHSGGGGFFGRLGAIGLPAKKVFTVHGWSFRPGTPFLQKIVAWKTEFCMRPLTDMVICVSKYDRALGLKSGVISKGRSCVVYNGTEAGEISERSDRELLTLIFAGRFASPKRQDLLLQAVESLPDALQQKLRINFLGGGPQEGELKASAQKLNLQDRVNFYSVPTEEMGGEYQKADALVLLSNYEALPMVIIEGLASGLPVVATRVGGIPEEIDETCGILVANNVVEIGAALGRLESPAERRDLSEGAKRRFEERFTLEKFLTETEKVYAKVLSTRE